MSIEEDIKVLENLIVTLPNFHLGGSENILRVLQDYARQKQINEEHQKINGELREKVKELEAKLEFQKFGDLVNIEFEEYMNQFIPKQVVKEVLQNNRNGLFGMTYLSKEQYKTCEMQIKRINKIEQELLGGGK